MRNRSIPTDSVLPHLYYRNLADASAWLTEVFGFCEVYSYGEKDSAASGVQMCLCGAYIMLKRSGPGRASPIQLGGATQSLTVFVDDVAAHFAATKVAGAKIVEDLHETVYGESQYGVEDLDGHWWIFSQHIADRKPAEWGATVSENQTYRFTDE